MRRLVFLALAACAAGPAAPVDPAATCDGKCDGDGRKPATGPAAATLRAKLYANLLTQMDEPAFLFGQERFNVTGVNADGTQWLASPGHVDRSDVETLVGDHPVVMGFDAWDLAIKPETWSPTPATHAEAAKYVHDHGGVVAMEFHMHGCAADTFDAAGNEACLCRLANDDAYARSWLLDGQYKRVADALVKLGLDRIPIIFRPLHEQNGSWFWWGKPYWNCAQYVTGPRFTGAAAYTRVYRTIIEYLRVERGLDNLLVAYSPGGNASLTTEAGYLDGYPGDEYVDILGADLYYQQSPSFAEQSAAFADQLRTIATIARTRGKVAAATEVGDTQLSSETSSHWWHDQALPLLANAGIAYALTWENRTSGAQQFWVPYTASPDFTAFAADPHTLLLTDAPAFDTDPAHGYPVCERCDSDPDGDRWGWEHGQSCRVGSWCLAPQYPACERCDSDPDGDGWGWEHAQSCEILATCR